MYEGTWPARDWRGLPYDKDSLQGKNAGKPLARGYRAVLLQLCGDLDYFSKWLDVPVSTNRTKPCAQCRASYHGNHSWLDNRENSVIKKERGLDERGLVKKGFLSVSYVGSKKIYNF
jgi:hypothetical protein